MRSLGGIWLLSRPPSSLGCRPEPGDGWGIQMRLRDSRCQFSGRLFFRGGPSGAIVPGVVLSLLLFGPLWTQSGAQEQTDPKELEAQLAAATGRVRLDLLIDLTEAYREDDPAKAIAFGREALE